jgi:hypothetical protein
MASTPNGSGGQYRLVYSEQARNALKGLLQKAKALGRAAEVAAAVKEIEGQLRTQPTVFGEPVYDLQHARLQVRAAIVGPLAVTYGVDEDKHLVYIVLPFRPLTSSGL